MNDYQQFLENLRKKLNAEKLKNEISQNSNISNEFLTKEQKINAINEYYGNYRREIDKELNNYLGKQYGGALLEIGSAALPMTKVGKVGGEIGKQVLKKQLGRKISENIGAGTLSGAASGGIFGLGESIMNETNPIWNTIKGTVAGGAIGGTLGSVGSNIQKAIKDNKLINTKDINSLTNIERQKLRNLGKQYYFDYLNGSQVTDPFKNTYNFPNSQIGEIRLFNYKMLPNIKNQIKGAKDIIQSNDKPFRQDANYFLKLHNEYNGKKYEYIMRNNKNGSGNDFYQIKEVGSNPAYSSHNRALKPEPDTNIPNYNPNYNPQTGNMDLLYGNVEINVNKNIKGKPTGQAAPVDNFAPHYNNQSQQKDFTGWRNPLNGDNKIFTRETIENMSNDEFENDEKAIFSQLNSIGIPKDDEMQNAFGAVFIRPYFRADGIKVKGHYRSR